jgi:lipoprotein-anchoring transpeptidase ErfK/SrfK
MRSVFWVALLAFCASSVQGAFAAVPAVYGHMALDQPGAAASTHLPVHRVRSERQILLHELFAPRRSSPARIAPPRVRQPTRVAPRTMRQPARIAPRRAVPQRQAAPRLAAPQAAPRRAAPQAAALAPRPAPAARTPAQRTIAPKFLPTTVEYATDHEPGTIVIDPAEKFLYLVKEDSKARRYGIGVGREGFGWSGTTHVGRKAQWPTWTPPREMIKRQPWLAKYSNGMPGGANNPLGARALYLFEGERDTLYRIHGSNEPWTIGQAVSSGCFRMRNEDVQELYEQVEIGAKVVVL